MHVFIVYCYFAYVFFFFKSIRFAAAICFFSLLGFATKLGPDFWSNDWFTV